MFLYEHLESFHGGDNAGVVDKNKSCSQVIGRYNGVCVEAYWR
jgi:hypothetical protein